MAILQPRHPGESQRGITLAAIGRRAGVSKATVSKVLNGRLDVSPDTRKRVQALLDAYGYGLSAMAAGRESRSRLVDLLIVGMDQAWAAPMLSGFGNLANGRGLDVVPSLTEGAVSDETLTRILARGTRGLILISAGLSQTQHQRLAARGIPSVMIAADVDEQPDARSVDIDYRAGVSAAVKHLLDQGHRRIGLIAGPRQTSHSAQRLLGYIDAIQAGGGRVDNALVRWGDLSRAAGLIDVGRLLDLVDPPTALVIGSDTVAAGAYAAVARRGLRVGEDVAIVGFDDRPEATWLRPQLSTVRIPVGELAALALDLLVDPIPAAQRISIAGDLVVRQSSNTACRTAAQSA